MSGLTDELGLDLVEVVEGVFFICLLSQLRRTRKHPEHQFSALILVIRRERAIDRNIGTGIRVLRVR